MNAQDAIDLGREAIMMALMIGGPVLLVGAAVGLLVGLLQALTQVQVQTISFVPKVVAMVVALAVCLPWLVQKMIDYSAELIGGIPEMLVGG